MFLKNVQTSFFSWPPMGFLVHKQENKSSSPMQLLRIRYNHVAVVDAAVLKGQTPLSAKRELKVDPQG